MRLVFPCTARVPARVLLTAAAAALVGCSGGLKSGAPAEQAYVLAAAPRESGASALPAHLQIAYPTMQPGLESDRIALIRPDRRLDYYAASRWAGPLPEVIEALAVETFRASGGLSAVQEDGSPFTPDYVLRMAVRHFEATYADGDGAPRVRVTIDCTLGRRADRVALAHFVADGAADAEANRLGAIVAAFERAAQTAFALAYDRTLEAVARDAPGAAQNVDSPLASMKR